MLAPSPSSFMAAERHQDADRQHDDRHQRAADMQQEDDADQRHDDAFLEQRVLERFDRRVDQIGAVIDRDDLDRLRQAAGDLLEALLDVLDHVERIDAEALQHDAAGHLALAVQFGDAAPLVRPQLDARDVAQQHRRSVAGLQHDVAEVVDALQVALAADDIFELGEFDGAAADIGVAGADRIAHLLHGDAEIAHPLRIEDDVVLLDEAADAGDLGDAFRLGQREFQVPVLDGARVREVQLLRHHGVLVDPADAGGVRTDGRRHARRQPRRRAVEEFQHPRAGPIDVGAVLEDDVDERHAEEGKAAHHFRPRHRQHRGGQGIGDLILDHLRRLTRIFRVDDDLGVGEIRDGVERQMRQRVDAGGGREAGAEEHQQQVARRPGDETGDHGLLSRVREALQRRLQIAFGVDQEVGGDDDRLAFGNALAHFDIAAAAMAEFHVARFEPPFALVDEHRLPAAGIQHRALGNGEHRLAGCRCRSRHRHTYPEARQNPDWTARSGCARCGCPC